MGLEDIGLFRSLPTSTILYPCDAVSVERSVELAANIRGIFYIRTTRVDTEILYDNDEVFEVGKCKVLRKSEKDDVCLVAAGITVYESLKAYDLLLKDGITARVIDLFSIKPVDKEELIKASTECKFIVTIEDHYYDGGIHSNISIN